MKLKKLVIAIIVVAALVMAGKYTGVLTYLTGDSVGSMPESVESIMQDDSDAAPVADMPVESAPEPVVAPPVEEVAPPVEQVAPPAQPEDAALPVDDMKLDAPADLIESDRPAEMMDQVMPDDAAIE